MESQRAKFIIVAVVALVIGYLAGRQHMKHEMEADFEHEMRALLMESVRDFKERPLETRFREEEPRVEVPPPPPPNIR